MPPKIPSIAVQNNVTDTVINGFSDTDPAKKCGSKSCTTLLELGAFMPVSSTVITPPSGDSYSPTTTFVPMPHLSATLRIEDAPSANKSTKVTGYIGFGFEPPYTMSIKSYGNKERKDLLNQAAQAQTYEEKLDYYAQAAKLGPSTDPGLRSSEGFSLFANLALYGAVDVQIRSNHRLIFGFDIGVTPCLFKLSTDASVTLPGDKPSTRPDLLASLEMALSGIAPLYVLSVGYCYNSARGIFCLSLAYTPSQDVSTTGKVNISELPSNSALKGGEVTQNNQDGNAAMRMEGFSPHKITAQFDYQSPQKIFKLGIQATISLPREFSAQVTTQGVQIINAGALGGKIFTPDAINIKIPFNLGTEFLLTAGFDFVKTLRHELGLSLAGAIRLPDVLPENHSLLSSALAASIGNPTYTAGVQLAYQRNFDTASVRFHAGGGYTHTSFEIPDKQGTKPIDITKQEGGPNIYRAGTQVETKTPFASAGVKITF